MPNIIETIFSDKNILLMVFGAVGGMARSLALKTTFAEGLRVVILGSLCAFGFGEGTLVFAQWWAGIDLSQFEGLGGLLSSGAFLVGLFSVTAIEYVIERYRPASEKGLDENVDDDRG